MYKYKGKNSDSSFRYKRPIDERTPEVLLEFNWKRKEIYPTFLEIELNFIERMGKIIQPAISKAPWEVETGVYKYIEGDVEKSRIRR